MTRLLRIVMFLATVLVGRDCLAADESKAELKAAAKFDVTGAWRIKDRGVLVKTEGELYDGTKIDGAAGLRAAILSRSDVVLTHFTEMLMAYAIGRRVEYFDMPTIRRIVRDAARNDYRVSSVILGVAESAAFRTAKADGK